MVCEDNVYKLGWEIIKIIIYNLSFFNDLFFSTTFQIIMKTRRLNLDRSHRVLKGKICIKSLLRFSFI